MSLISSHNIHKRPKLYIYLSVIISISVLQTADAYADTFGVKFVTLFPWNDGDWDDDPAGECSFDVINPSENETAHLLIDYGDNLHGSGKQLLTINVTVPPASSVKHIFNATVMPKLRAANTHTVRSSDARIFVSSNLPVSIVECIFTPANNGDCFTVLPVTMAGSYYAFTMAKAAMGGSFTVYFLPVEVDVVINIDTVTKRNQERDILTIRGKRSSQIYAYNSSLDAITLYVSSNARIHVILSMRLYVQPEATEHFGCTMLTPVPEKPCFQRAVRDDFDVHFAPLDSSSKTRTQLTIAAPLGNCALSSVTAFRRNFSLLKLRIDSKTVNDEAITDWKYSVNDSTVGLQSSTTLFQILRFESYNNFGSFLDIVPAYAQYLTGRTHFLLRNKKEQLFLYDFPRQNDYFLLDGLEVNAEYVEYFINPIRYVKLRKIRASKLRLGLHYFESAGKYMFFIYSGNKDQIYGYVPAFNAYPAQDSFHPTKYRSGMFGVQFVTLFPWMQANDPDRNAITAFSFDIINPHPYLAANVLLTYSNIRSNDSEEPFEQTISVKPNSFLAHTVDGEVMTKPKNISPDHIFQSTTDTRIWISSNLPVSIIQHCFIADGPGDSFGVLPLKMAGRRYSFSLPESLDADSHSIVYFIPISKPTNLQVTAITRNYTENYDLNVDAAKGSSLQVYYGTNEAVTIYASGNAPFQVIISMQRMLLIPDSKSKHSVDFGSTMAAPVSNYACKFKPQNDLYDLHYLLVALRMNFSGFFTMTPSRPTCSPYNATTYPVNEYQFSVHNMHFVPRQLQKFRVWNTRAYSWFQAVHCENDFLQVYNFGNSHFVGSYIDFIPSVSQYVTGRNYFAVRHPDDWIMIFMDKEAAKDIEIDGIYLALDNLFDIPSPHAFGYFIRQRVDKVDTLHYVQSTGRYALIITSDERDGRFYEYFTTLNISKEVAPKKETPKREAKKEEAKRAPKKESPKRELEPLEMHEIYDIIILRFLPIGDEDYGKVWLSASDNLQHKDDTDTASGGSRQLDILSSRIMICSILTLLIG